MKPKYLWEILVPCEMNGHPCRTVHHKNWDEMVRKIAGGLTVYKPGHGQWTSENEIVHKDRVIPVRIYCNKLQINKIADITLIHYNQEAVLYWLVSKKIIIKEKK